MAPRRGRAEAQLLWEAAAPQPDAERIHAALAERPDVASVALHALRNRVGPLFWRTAEAFGFDDAAGEMQELLARDAAVRRAQEEMVLPDALHLSLDPLRAIGIEPLVFKGPALAARYPGPGLRPMDDIDIIVPADDHPRALRELVRIGWQVVEERPGNEHYDSYLVHPDVPDLVVELHWELAVWRDRTNGIRAATLLKKRQPVELGGVAAFGIPVEYELVALAAHAGKPFHYFSRLIWSVDIAVVIATAGNAIDWDHVDRIARRYGCGTVLTVALRHAARFGAISPSTSRSLPSNQRRRLGLEPLLDERWPVLEITELAAHRLRYALWDSPLRQGALLVGELTKDATPRESAARTIDMTRDRARRRWNQLRRRANGDDD